MGTYQEILKKYWGYDDFRGIQRDIIESIGLGCDTLGLMPTGGGKSITFQVPAMALEGVCIVITPLIALMKDQVHHLRQLGILASAIHSGMEREAILRVLDNCILGNTKFLYVSPERLSTDIFITKLRHMRVCFITVDEAHCISQWGYDFRPSYLEIATIRTLLPNIPVLALTATATPQVIDDICEKLSLPTPITQHPTPNTQHPTSTTQHPTPNTQHPTPFRVFRMSFERKNLIYLVRNVGDKVHELVHILSHTQGSTIVYVRSRKRSKELSEYLNEAGLHATFYHAGIEQTEKDQRQRDWQHDRIRIMVATNAFGMGIDKPDVRLVIHYDCPDSIEAYFQEAGRAGRDGQQAYAVMLYNNSDNAKLAKRIDDTFPPRDYIRQVYEHLAYYYQIATGDGYGVCREFNIDEFCQRFHHFPIRVNSALQILTRAGYIDYEESPDQQTRIRFLLERHELYRLNDSTPDEERVIIALLRNYGGLFADFGYVDEAYIAQQAALQPVVLHEVLKALAHKHIIEYIPRQHVPTIRYMQRREDSEHIQLLPAVYEQRLQQYRQRIHAMLEYLQCQDKCRSRQLLAYFGETHTKDCGQCDVCRNNTPDDKEQARQAIIKMVEDGQRHHVTELHKLPFSTETIDYMLAKLIQNEDLFQEDGYLFRR